MTTPSQSKPTKMIVFDFNRTLYDPEGHQLFPGARQLLDLAAERGYRLVLLSQAVASRAELIRELGLARYFVEIQLVERKGMQLIAGITERYRPNLTQSYVVGDRALGEVRLGYQAGWQTIWLKAGRFADELPGFSPTHTVTSLSDIENLI